MNMLKSILLAIALFAITAGKAWADQLSIISEPVAIRAVELLKDKPIKFYCAPCSDKIPKKPAKIANLRYVSLADNPAQYKIDYDVMDDNKKEHFDLAYVYFNKNGVWKNVAMELGLEPVLVPETIK